MCADMPPRYYDGALSRAWCREEVVVPIWLLALVLVRLSTLVDGDNMTARVSFPSHHTAIASTVAAAAASARCETTAA